MTNSRSLIYPIITFPNLSIKQKIGNSKLAIDHYNKALQLQNTEIEPEIYSGLGNIFLNTGDFSKAVDSLQKAMQLMDIKTRKYVYTSNSLGYAFANLSKFEDAEIIYDKSLSLSKEIKEGLREEDIYFFIFLKRFCGGFYINFI